MLLLLDDFELEQLHKEGESGRGWYSTLKYIEYP